MKSIQHLGILIFTLLAFSKTFSQETIEIKKPTEGKSLVYFIRPTAVAFLVDFKVFDKDTFLGTLSSKKYFTYECEPGEHLFWATSENRDYVIANLEANKTYVINVSPQIGAFVAGVNLIPYDPNIANHKKLFNKALTKGKEMVQDEKETANDQSETIQKGLEKYEELVASESTKIARLNPNMNFENANKE